MTIDSKTLGMSHPLLPAKLKMDEEKRTGEEQKYKLLYEKTYSGGSTDDYEFSIRAETPEQAIELAKKKLILKDMMATWSTDISDALLISPDGEELLVPSYSRKLREAEEKERREQEFRSEVQRYMQIIDNKSYGVQREDGALNRDCYDFRCEGEFTDIKSEYDFIAVSCTNSLCHKDKERGRLSFRNGLNLEENIANALHRLRETQEDQMTKLREWMRDKWDETDDSNQGFEEWLEKQKLL